MGGCPAGICSCSSSGWPGAARHDAAREWIDGYRPGDEPLPTLSGIDSANLRHAAGDNP